MSALSRGILFEPMNADTEKLRERVCGNLLAADYRFAKTMPDNPHWYTLRKNWTDDAAFVEAVAFIRRDDVGYIEIFKKSKYKMFNLNGYKYWTMGAPINNKKGEPCTILINRAKTGEPADYDLIADRYDTLFADIGSRHENVEVFNLLAADQTARILDIGCGTGLFLDCHNPTSYTGLDPSAQMLGELVTRHPRYAGDICHTRFEEFYDGDGFDLIVSLFGSMNYIAPATLARVPAMLRPGGRAFLMFYQERYVPVTYERSGIAFPHQITSEYDLTDWKITPHRDTYLIAEFKKPKYTMPPASSEV